MKPQTLTLAILLAIPLVLQAGSDSPQGATTAPQAATPPSTHVVLQDADLKWGDPPPAFERGAQLAVLSGDPGKPGLFVIRIKAPAGYRVANHFHPADEHVPVGLGTRLQPLFREPGRDEAVDRVPGPTLAGGRDR